MGTEVLRETFSLVARSTAPAQARHRTLAWLARHSVAPHAAETAVLVVSELVTNAVVHTGSAAVSCTLQLTADVLRVEVTDQGTSPTSPAAKDASADDVSGRGLMLVSAVCAAWGAVPALPCGWTVWATVRMTP